MAIDRAELLASLAGLVGVDAAVSAASRTLDPTDLAAAVPYLQPLALSAATRKQAGKSMLRELRTAVAEASDQEPVPLEQLIRVRPRTLLMVATLTGAFYFLLPQLANVDESIEAVSSANWGWLAGAVVLSGATYVFSAIGMDGGVEARLPLVPTVQAQLASSFVNRVTPANVGGMALNVRYMQKAGVEPAAAVTGMGLNVIAGGIVHIGLLFLFLAWAGRSEGGGFSIPSSSKLLVAIAVVLALVGLLLATRWGRRFFRTKVLRFVKDSLSSMVALAHSPGRLLALFGGSVGVTLAYAAALACADRGIRRWGELRPGGRGVPGFVGGRRRRADAGRTGCDGGRAGRRLHCDRNGPGHRRRRRAQLPPGDVLAPDPARVARVPAPGPAGAHLDAAQYWPWTVTVRSICPSSQTGPPTSRRPSQSTSASWLATGSRAQPLLAGEVGTLLAPWMAWPASK